MSQAHEKPPLLPALLFLATSGAWVFFENYAHLGMEHGKTTYDWDIESLSDLGVDYRQVHPLKHYNVTSHRHAVQNFNFVQLGVGFGLAQLYLLYATRRRATQQNALLRTIRLVMTLAFAGGIILMGQVHGGPREKHWKIIGWHWMGFAMAAVAGNINSLIAAAVPTVGSYESGVMYRAVSGLCGAAGLYSFYRFQTLGEWDYQTKIGLWQRGSIYPVMAWSAVTALILIASNFPAPAPAPPAVKGKKAQ